MMYFNVNTTRSKLIGSRLAFSILQIGRLMGFLLACGMFWRVVQMWPEELFVFDYYDHAIGVAQEFGAAGFMVAVAILGIVSMDKARKLNLHNQVREVLNPRFNVWHDSQNVVVRIGGFVLSLSCYLLAIAMWLFGLFGINFLFGNLEVIRRFVADRTGSVILAGNLLNHLAEYGYVVFVICFIMSAICWVPFMTEPSREEEEEEFMRVMSYKSNK